ncbi:DUF2971 domain-containing protein [Pseudoalteromonas denitrificans]|uniref:TPR repeat n=1 Tax=Pseudoalteromonas denitrificans DSM 6059 TaxID=1123010 RepID=A0A1I1G4A2_9GAMM|nr:DUF2971 domain-containing protein [Pseudoalteromonas denitrificans]SFC06434.1 TPR repeat [Pseudoalteromonas denitrificans DSM 6059]
MGTMESNETLEQAIMFLEGNGVPKDLSKASSILAQLAEQGNPLSQFKLARMYENGEGVEVDLKKAIALYTLSAEQGDKDAQNNLANMYANGEGVEVDLKKAIALYTLSAEQGHRDAQNNLANMYANGEGVEVDLKKAIALYTLSAEQGQPDAQFNLAWMYDEGEGITKNLNIATKFYTLAAKQGCAESQNNLGVMFENGQGKIKKDINLALKWYTLSAKQDNEYGLYNLANLYKNGTGVKKNDKKAFSLFKQSFELGYEQAKYNLPNKLAIDLLQKHKFSIALNDAFITLDNTIRIIKKRHIYNGSDPLSHFTTWPAIESLLPLEQNKNTNLLRLYHVDYMNDPNEGLALSNVINNTNNACPLLEKIFNYRDSLKYNSVIETLPSVYSVSFTHSSDRLDLWRAYANDGNGFCIVTYFDKQEDDDTFENASVNAFHLHRNPTLKQSFNSIKDKTEKHLDTTKPLLFEVKYDDKSKKKTIRELNLALLNIEKALESAVPKIKTEVNHILYAVLMEVMYLYKDEQYSTEREVRAFQTMPLNEVKMDERNPGRLYCETNPFLFLGENTKIVIGPKVPEPHIALWNLRYRLNKNGFANNTNVEYSTVKYR